MNKIISRIRVISIIRKQNTLKIIKTGRGWIDVKSLDNNITMRWWNFMWNNLVKKYR